MTLCTGRSEASIGWLEENDGKGITLLSREDKNWVKGICLLEEMSKILATGEILLPFLGFATRVHGEGLQSS